MVLGTWLIEKIRERQRKERAEWVDKEFGAGTFERLEEDKSRKRGRTPKPLPPPRWKTETSPAAGSQATLRLKLPYQHNLPLN